ncbi:MAG: SulP family inorganic anion transporter [Planctomycetota bacterium]|nr:SulP family inorganic anion transporter [Planctomycetota bacterium]
MESNRADRSSGSGRLLQNLAAGTLSCLVTLSYSAGYGAMIFSGGLKDCLASGMSAALTASWVVALVVAAGSSFRFAIGGPDSNATAVLALAAASIASRMAAEGLPPAAAAPTVMAFLSAGAILAGAALYAIGALKWGRMVRFIPHPVTGGFLAGTGYLILDGAFRVAAGAPLTADGLRSLSGADPLALGPALLVAGILFVVPRFRRPFFLVPAAIALGAAAFYCWMFLSGRSAEECRAAGLLFQRLDASPWGPSFLIHAREIRWDILAAHIPEFLAMTMVTGITILLNATGLDLATGKDADFDRELRAAGLANMASGALGGMPGYQSISRSLINLKAGASGRLAGVWCAGLCFAAAAAAPGLFAYFPKPALAGLLLYLGASLLAEWAVLSCRKLPRREYALILTILAVIAWKGFLAGVAFGIVVACVLFAFSYGRTGCIRHEFDASVRSSNVERPIGQMEILKGNGGRIYGIGLQGFLFFGTSNEILDRVRARIASAAPPSWVIVDFRFASGLDSSAALSFVKLEQICASRGIALAFSGLNRAFRESLRKGGAMGEGAAEFEDLDRALEWAEEGLLAREGAAAGPAEVTGSDLERHLAPHFDREALAKLLESLETVELPAGAFLFRRGERGDSIYFVESGRVSVSVPLEGGGSARLRAFGAGTIAGEMGLYSGRPRSADVVADVPARARRLTRERLRELERDFPRAAIQFHNFVAKVLAARLAAANEEMRSLM